MNKNPADMIGRLKSMIEPRQQTWDLSQNDVNSIAYAISEIERLTTVNADLKRKIELEPTDKLTRVNAELAIAGVDSLVEIRRLKHKCNSLLKVINNCKPEHYPAKEDLQWEVIE